MYAFVVFVHNDQSIPAVVLQVEYFTNSSAVEYRSIDVIFSNKNIRILD